MSSSENRNVLSTATGCSDCSKKLHWEFFNMLDPGLQSNFLSDHSNNTSFKGVVSFIWGGRQMLNNSINKTYCHIICLYLIGNIKFMLWSFPLLSNSIKRPCLLVLIVLIMNYMAVFCWHSYMHLFSYNDVFNFYS